MFNLSKKLGTFILSLFFLLAAGETAEATVLGVARAAGSSLLRSPLWRPSTALFTRTIVSNAKSEAQERKTVRVLSIDGGGIRAIIPLYVLKEMEDRTGKPIAQLFDIVAGTSTGGLVSLALNVPREELEKRGHKEKGLSAHEELGFVPTGQGVAAYSASDVLRVYEKHADMVFTGRKKYGSNTSMFRIFLDKGSYRPRHSIDKLDQLLTKCFGELKLSQSLSTVLTTAYEIQRGTSHLFNSQDAKESSYNDFLMKDVALSTSAAPTYFSPMRVTDLRPEDKIPEVYHFVDGGVVSNNPTLRAYTQARKLFPKANDFFIVSLGTGKTTGHYIEYDKIKDKGVIGWAPLITPMMMHATSDAVRQQIDEILYELRRTDDQQRRWLVEPRYHRLDVHLTDELLPLDKIDDKHIKQLKIKGKALITEHEGPINQIVTELSVPRSYASGLEKNVLIPGKDLCDEDLLS